MIPKHFLENHIKHFLTTSSRVLAGALLVALASPPVAAQTDTFTAGSGLWSTNSSWSLQQPPGPSNDCVIPANSNVTDDTAGTCFNYTMQSGSVVTAPANSSAYLSIYGPNFVNQGTLNIDSLNGAGFYGSGTQTISGGGTINIASRGIGPSSSMLVNVDNTIHGASGFYFATLTNKGLIDANVPSTQLTVQSGPSGLTNSGTIQASNGGILLLSGAGFDPPLNNNGGIIQALNGSFMQFGGYVLTGGTLTTTGTGVLQVINSSFFNNFTNNGNFQVIGGGYTILGGTVVNNSAFTAPMGGFYANGALTLKGSGKVTGGGGLFFHGWSNGSTLTLQQPLFGGGTIGDSMLTFINKSTVNANNPSSILTLTGNVPEVNTGTFEASDGAMLEVTNTVNNAGGTIAALEGSTVLLDYAGTINGGTITTKGTGVVESWSGTLDGTTSIPTNRGLINVPVGDTLNLEGTINNDGIISLGPDGGFLGLIGSTTLSGTGQVAMAPNSAFLAGSTFTLTNESTISGAGNLGGGEMGIVNKGNIVASNTTTPLLISPDSAGFSTTGGTLTVKAGCNLTMEITGPFKNFSNNTLTGGTYAVGGVLEFPNANIVTNSAKITLTGAVAEIVNSGSNANALTSLATNSGLLSLQSGQLLTTAVSLTNKGTVTVGANSGLGVGGRYTQSGGTTTVDGVISAPLGFLIQSGKVFGTGTISAPVTSSAAVTAGDSATKPGKFSVTTYTQTGTGTLNISIGGTSAGPNYGQLASSNGVALGGTLNIKRINGFSPKIGQTFSLINGSTVGGQFATVNGLSINSSEHFQINYNPTSVTLTVVSGA